MKKHNKKLGIILTETLIAIGMIAVGVVISSSIINSSITTIKTAQNFLTAQNLITEGIESVKNIRNTNWLKNPNESSCWLRTDVTIDDCSSATFPNTTDNYIADNGSGIWKITEVSAQELDLSGTNVTGQELYRLYIDDNGLYTNNASGNTSSNFYRSVKFTKITADQAEFEIKVQWKDGVKIVGATRKYLMANYR